MAAYPLRAAFAGVLLFVLGLGIAGGVYQVNEREQEQLRGWRRAGATVVDLLKRRTPQGEVPVPLVAFTTAAGERVTVTLSPSRNASAYSVNAPVTVLYPPDHPQDAIIDTSARRWTRNALAGGAALILTVLGGYVAWYASRWDRVNSPRT
jgi:hypothetical protein